MQPVTCVSASRMTEGDRRSSRRASPNARPTVRSRISTTSSSGLTIRSSTANASKTSGVMLGRSTRSSRFCPLQVLRHRPAIRAASPHRAVDALRTALPDQQNNAQQSLFGGGEHHDIQRPYFRPAPTGASWKLTKEREMVGFTFRHTRWTTIRVIIDHMQDPAFGTGEPRAIKAGDRCGRHGRASRT